MATGQSGDYGKSVQRAVDKVTGPGPEPAVTHQLSTAGSPVVAALWIQSCVSFGLAQVRDEWFKVSGVPHRLLFFFPKPKFSQLVLN